MNITLKQTLCRPVPIPLEEAFKKEIDKILQAGIIKLKLKLILFVIAPS